MRRAGVLLGLALLGGVARGEEPAADAWKYDAAVTGGYRFVDVDGSRARYQTDVDLRSGPRLFLFQVDGAAPDPDTSKLDRFHLEVDTPGEEPASYFQLTANDRKHWDFRADFTRSRWIYDVPQLWEEPVAGVNSIVDLHTWNYIRTQGHVDLAIHPVEHATVRFGYRLYDQDGEGTSTVFSPPGDTFRLNAPTDSTAHVGLLGTDFRWLATDWSLTQEYRSIDRRFDAKGPRDPLGTGLDPTDNIALDNYTRRNQDHVSMPVTIVRVARPIGDDAEITGDYLYSHAELDGSNDRLRRVTSVPLPTGNSNIGDASGSFDTQVADLGGTVKVAPGVSLNASYRYNERTQNADVTTLSGGALITVNSRYAVRWNSLTGDVQWEPGWGLSMRAGGRYAHRDAVLPQSGERRGSDYFGAIADVRWRPRREFDAYLRYENVRIDDPLTTPGSNPLTTPPIPAREIVLTSTNRGTAGFRVTPRPWVSLQYEFVSDSRENDSFAGVAESFGNSIGCSLTPLDGLSLFAGYTRRDVKSQANIRVAPIYDVTLSAQDGSEDAVTSNMRWEFPLVGQRWATGWDFSWVLVDDRLQPRLENGGGTRTPYHVDRIDGGAFIAFLHPWIEPSIEVRRIEYGEKVLSGNAYQATIVALKLTKRFGY